MVCITNPIVNSYKRFVSGYDAPCYISWSENSKSLLIRIPTASKPENTRIELRSPDSTANPYLAIAACLKAGLKGIKENIELPPAIDSNIYNMSAAEQKAMNGKMLPINLNEAVEIAKKSEFITELLGEDFKQKYLSEKKNEYSEYRKCISKWEIDKYFIQY